jgi:hypothetical protein
MNKTFQKILQESEKEEREAKVKKAHESFEGAIELLDYDLLSIQDLFGQLHEASFEQKVNHLISSLNSDTELLIREANDETTINIPRSNQKLINLAGRIQSVSENIQDTPFEKAFNEAILNLKEQLHQRIERHPPGLSLIGISEATKLWNRLPKKEKDQRLVYWEEGLDGLSGGEVFK